MNLTKIPFLSTLAARLDFLAARTATVAENIANADTPGFVAKDIEPSGFKALAEKSASSHALRVSDPRHIAAGSEGGVNRYRAVSAPDGEASINGNQVSLETQAMKLSATRQDYALATNVYRKGLQMLRLAARGN